MTFASIEAFGMRMGLVGRSGAKQGPIPEAVGPLTIEQQNMPMVYGRCMRGSWHPVPGEDKLYAEAPKPPPLSPVSASRSGARQSSSTETMITAQTDVLTGSPQFTPCRLAK